MKWFFCIWGPGCSRNTRLGFLFPAVLVIGFSIALCVQRGPDTVLPSSDVFWSDLPSGPHCFIRLEGTGTRITQASVTPHLESLQSSVF
jgi:hypothetical protein